MSITSVVSLAAGKIGELLVEEAKFLCGVEDQVLSLQKELKMMQSFLVDMEAMYEGGDERSRTTIKEIRKIAYLAEDLIESHVLEASSSADKERFLKRYLCFCNSVVSTHQMGSEIEAITKSINETMEMWKKYVGENGVRRINDAGQGSNEKNSIGKRSIAYEHNKEDHVVGLDEDIKKLVGVLTDEEGYTNIKVVVSIVGMGGSGKTTLARKLFKHETVKKHFNCMAWVSVSQQWVAKQIILDLLKKAGEETWQVGESSNGHQVLVGKLHQYLEMKRYLIVLDDVWEDKALEEILPALPLGSSGGKIVVTSRNEEVVDYPDLKPITYPHKPRCLNEGESWELFRKIALIFREETSNSTNIARFEELGKEMLKKCRGLPLAVIALAGILSQKKTFQAWENVANAVASRIMDKGKGTHLYGPVNKMLALSYSDLPRELKPCFLYLARYPEDYEIPVGQLIKMWIAEGFFTSSKPCEGETVEDVARCYLDELIHRCLVEVARRNYEGKVNRIRLHDLVRDLCIKKANEEDFLEIFDSKGPNSDVQITESRRSAILSYDGILLPFPKKSGYLSSLAYEDCTFGGKQSLSLQPIHENYKLLRVLILEGIKTSDESLPAGIGSLVHLRYLRLYRTNIVKLPSSIGNLRNLLTLDYRGDLNEKVRIPDVFWKIEGLRHLYLYLFPSSSCTLETFKLHTLMKLETLKLVGVGGSWMLKELPLLSSTLQKLRLLEIKSKEQLEAAFQSPSIRSDRLHSLMLDWNIKPSEEGGSEVVRLETILQHIIHCQHLRKLSLGGKMGDRLTSNSYGLVFPASIMWLELWETELEEEATLAALGRLPQLTILKLVNEAYRGIQWTVSAEEFLQLKELYVHNLRNLEEWSIEMGAMPQLRKLQIAECRKLRKVPEGLKFITTLKELKLVNMHGLKEMPISSNMSLS